MNSKKLLHSEVSRKGGLAFKHKYSKAFIKEISQKGVEARRKLYGPEYWRANLSKAWSANRKKKEKKDELFTNRPEGI